MSQYNLGQDMRQVANNSYKQAKHTNFEGILKHLYQSVFIHLNQRISTHKCGITYV